MLLVVVCVLAPAIVVGLLAALLVAHRPAIASPSARLERITSRLAARPRLLRFLQARTDPAAVTGLALTALSLVTMFVGAALGVLLVMIRRKAGFASLDLRLAEFGAEHAAAGATDVMRAMSLVGGTSGGIAASIVVGAVEWRRTPTRNVPAFLAVVVLGQFAVANGIKLLVDRARPTIDQLTSVDSTSFPSGHSTAAAATFAACALLLGRGRSRPVQAVLAGIAVGLAVAVAGTRVMLGVHWLTDVLAGLLLGWAWFAACSIAFGGRLLRFGQPVETVEEAATGPALRDRRA